MNPIIDGVIKVGIDFDEPIYPWFNYAHKVSVTAGLATASMPVPTVWDPHTVYGVPRDRWLEVLDAEVEKGTEGMYAWPCDPNAIKAIRRLYTSGYEVHIVTARGSFGSKGHLIRELTKRQLLVEQIPHTALHFAPDKEEALRQNGIHYHLDDRPKHYAEAFEAGATPFLYSMPWNVKYPVPSAQRVHSLDEFVDLIIDRHGDLSVLTVAQRNATSSALWDYKNDPSDASVL